MNLLNIIEQTFRENNIRYFIGEAKEKKIINVPYCGIDNTENHINIYIDIDEELKLVKFTFLEKANKNIDIDTIRKKLLDLNSNLTFGNLSMRSESNTIEYRIEYQLINNEFSFQEYNIFIVRCINTYEKLQKEDII